MTGRQRQIWRVNILIDEASWSSRTRLLLTPLMDYRNALARHDLEGRSACPYVDELMVWVDMGEARLGRHIYRALVELLREHLILQHAAHLEYTAQDPRCFLCSRTAAAASD